MAHRSVAGRPGVLLAVTATLLFVCASCGEIPEPEGFSVATTTSLPANADGAPVLHGPATSQGTTTSSIFVPQQQGYVPEILISTANQVLLASATSATTTEPLTGAFADLGSIQAADDLLGGLVVQHPGTATGVGVGADTSTDAGGEIVWYDARAQEPRVVDDSGARLLDVGYVGAPFAVVLSGTSQINGIRLVDDELTPILTLDPDEELLDLSARAGMYAVVVGNEQCGDLRLYNSEGDEVPMAGPGEPGPGEPDCIVPRRPAYGAVALSPDGSAMVYTVVSYRDDSIEVSTDLVVRDLVTGLEIFRRQIAEDAERVSALSFDGDLAVYLVQSAQGNSVTVLPIDSQAIEFPIDLLGETAVNSVTFTRIQVADGT